MKQLSNLLVTAAVAVGLVAGVNVPANAATPGPPAVSVKFNSATATVSWGAVLGGVKNYTVVVSRDGYAGPFAGYTTTATSINIGYKSFPYATAKSTQPFRFSVSANGSGWSSQTGSVKISTSGTKVTVSKANANAVAAKINSCLKQGLAAGIVVGAVGATATAVTIWVPGVDIAVAGTSISATLLTTAGATAACLVA